MPADHRALLRIVLAYVAFAALWILLSDEVVHLLLSDPADMVRISILKGWLFVVVTAGLLYTLLLRYVAGLEKAHQRELAARAEQQRTLRMLEAVTKDSADAVVIKDLDGRYVFANPAAEAIVGLKLAQTIGRRDQELFPQATADSIVSVDRKVLASNATMHYESILPTSRGNITVEVAKSPLHDDAGQTIGVFAVFRDISARKESEAVLRESESKFRALVELSLAGIYIIQDYRFRYVNPAFAEIFGYSGPDAIIERLSIQDLICEEDRKLVAENVRRRIDGEVEDVHYSFRGSRQDGRQIYVEVHGRSFVYRGRPAVIGIARDVTERRETEEHLRKLAQAVEQSPESIVITNLDAEIEYVNEAFLRANGYTREEVIGQNPRILQSGKTPADRHLEMWGALTAGQMWKGEFLNRRKDGSEYVEFAIITPLRDSEGKITHYVAVKEDITEKTHIREELDHHRHHLEDLVASRTAELEEARKVAETASRAKSAFLANMSHEIRTPMNAILGLTELLRRNDPTPEQAERLTKIDEAAGHLLSIINDILDLSKIEAGRLALEHTDFSLDSVLDHTRSLIAEQAQRKGLTIEVDSDGVPHSLCGDPTRLRQALLNFAGNAVKFTLAGSICLRVRVAKDGGETMLLRFEVEDTGIGIEPENLPRLFADFEQGDVSNTRKFGGTGLGLAITRRLAELMGGTVGVSSTVGKGSLFWFTARVDRGYSPEPLSPISATPADDGRLERTKLGGTVLLVEDNEVNREVAMELLGGFGVAVDTACDGLEAVAKARNWHYDLVLMDVQMPLMDGLEATRSIRGLPGWRDTPIVAMTANAFEDDRRTCLDAGMNDFVSKPVSPEALFSCMNKWLPARRQVQPPSDFTEPASSETEFDVRRLNLPGLDVDVGLHSIRGRTASYMRLLRQFGANHAHDVDALDEALKRGDTSAARSVAHALKGVSGMLGATAVQRLSTELEAAILEGRRSKDIENRIALLRAEMSPLIEALKDLPEGAPAAASAQGAETAIARLEQLLADNDMEATAYVATAGPELHAALGDREFAELSAKIAAVDFSGALGLLRQLHQQ